MTSVGRYSAQGGTLRTESQCPSRHLDLGQDVWGDILHKGTSCPLTSLYHICQATSQVSSGNEENSHSQVIEFRDPIVSYQQYGYPLTDASEDVHWFIVLAWILLLCSKYQCNCQSSHDSKEEAKLTSIKMASAPLVD